MIKFDENGIGIPIPLNEEIIIYITDLKQLTLFLTFFSKFTSLS